MKVNVDIINVLQVNTADNAMNLSNMLNIMDMKMDRAKPQLFSQEVDHLCHLHKTDSLAVDTTKTLNILRSENKAIGYYISETTGNNSVRLFHPKALDSSNAFIGCCSEILIMNINF